MMHFGDSYNLRMLDVSTFLILKPWWMDEKLSWKSTFFVKEKSKADVRMNRRGENLMIVLM